MMESIIQMISRDSLTDKAFEQIIAMCNRAYGEDLSSLMDTFTESVHILAWLQSTLVSHALWVTRWLQIGNEPPLRTAYVEAVATEPAYQCRGYASAVMKVIRCSIGDYQIGGLSPSDPHFYQRFGWELWRGPLFIRKDDSLLPTPDDEQVMILRLPATPEIDLSSPLSAEWREGELW
jgi:aminoglycoside 2'-N-acetyltransferase I